MTLVVNIYGGPGTGKSTTAAGAFSKLKRAGCNAELVTEYAKDATWEERHNVLGCQAYIFGKQLWRVERLLGKVDVVVTDSPILLSLVYGKPLGQDFLSFVRQCWHRMETFDVFLERDTQEHPYNPAGRSQTETEARAIDEAIKHALDMSSVPYTSIPYTSATERIVDAVTAKVAA